jgi:hypothetical protein
MSVGQQGTLKTVRRLPDFFGAQPGRGINAWQLTKPRETGVTNGFALVGTRSVCRRRVRRRSPHGAHAYGGVAGAIAERAGSQRHALVGDTARRFD